MPKPAAIDDRLILKYVPLSTLIRWGRNTKRHDLPTIIASLKRHGFKDPLKYEPSLNNGKGGIVEGNGRDEALKEMFRLDPKKPPRGVINDGKDWLAPVLFGVDAISEKAAEAYGYDHNNITMMGGGIDMNEMMSMYEEQAAKMLRYSKMTNCRLRSQLMIWMPCSTLSARDFQRARRR